MKKIIALVVGLVAAIGVRAQTIAVLGFDSDSFSLESRTATMSDLLTNELVDANEDLDIVERILINKVLEEMDFQQTTGYTDMTTAKSIGKMLNADYIVAGNVNMTGAKMTVTARMIDVESAKILSTSNMSCSSWSEFNRKLPDFANKLVSKIPQPNYFAGTWLGGSNEIDDTYEIRLEEKGRCFVTLITINDFDEDMEFTGTGSWTYDSSNNMFRLDARLSSEMGKSKKISWRNFAKLDKSRDSFNFVIQDGTKQYRLTFARTE